ncbi:hypothetical protein [Macrococcus lamae]|uniref:Uncharacterized protein n=1 Tax=Macrococcus lamae TaxID=198484 RepID=A0A4R6BTN3_9STAP|nr:hypothetical protein [Macrococcus lamae]TDM10462.1 hypothetical protein ERX29_07265 [Macrococcus lamae]
MNSTYKKLFVFILGLIEIIAGFAVYNTSVFGGITLVALGLIFFAVMFMINLREKDPKHPYIY